MECRVFVPFCCTGLANIRRYLADGSGTVLAERANEFASVYSARCFSRVRGEYLWVYYHRSARDASGTIEGVVNGELNVTTIKRYSLDLEEEATFQYKITPSGQLNDSLLETPEYDGFDVVDGVAPVAVIAYRLTDTGDYAYKLRCWNADGSIRWTVDSPVAPLAYGRILATHAVSGGVWMVWQQAVPGGITPPDPNDPNPPPPQPTDYTIEVYADLRSKTTGALLTRVSLQALHKTDPFIGFAQTYASTKAFVSCDAGQGRIAVVSTIGYTVPPDTEAGPTHRRAAIVAADASGYTWFRLRRPSTAGSTTAVAGYEAFGTFVGDDTVSYAIAPQTTRGQTTHGLWVHSYSQLASVLWQWTLDGTYVTEKDTLSVAPAIDPPTTDFLAKRIYQSNSIIGRATATNADYDDNGALMYVRQVDRTEGTYNPIVNYWRYRFFGTVWKVRNNQTEQWETPTFTVLSDLVEASSQYGGGIYDTWEQAKVAGGGMSIANDRDNDTGTYFLVGAGAF